MAMACSILVAGVISTSADFFQGLESSSLPPFRVRCHVVNSCSELGVCAESPLAHHLAAFAGLLQPGDQAQPGGFPLHFHTHQGRCGATGFTSQVTSRSTSPVG